MVNKVKLKKFTFLCKHSGSLHQSVQDCFRIVRAFPLFRVEALHNVCFRIVRAFPLFGLESCSILCVSALFVHSRYSISKPSILNSVCLRIVHAFQLFGLEACSILCVSALFVHYRYSTRSPVFCVFRRSTSAFLIIGI
jgi:hypothetical protein